MATPNVNSETDSDAKNADAETNTSGSDIPTTDDGVPDMSTSGEGKELSPSERRKRSNEIYSRLTKGRGEASTVTLQTPYEEPFHEIVCDINLSKLDRETRWNCLSALPDGMFRAANNEDDESDIEISSSVVPDGEGVIMLQLIVQKTLEPRGFSKGDWDTMIEEDMADDVLIQVGIKLLEMSFDRGEITGFRFD